MSMNIEEAKEFSKKLKKGDLVEAEYKGLFFLIKILKNDKKNQKLKCQFILKDDEELNIYSDNPRINFIKLLEKE